MVLIHYDRTSGTIKKEVAGAPFGMLINQKGSFLCQTTQENSSRFQGFFLRHHETMYKVIETLMPEHDPADVLSSQGPCLYRKKNARTEKIFLDQENAVLYEIKEFSGKITLTLDCRKIYDYHDQGRIYTFSEENGTLVVSYHKWKNESSKDLDYEIHLAIITGTPYTRREKWVKRVYPLDKGRNSSPFELYTYEAVTYTVKRYARIILGCGISKEEAIKNAMLLARNYEAKERHASSWWMHVTQGKVTSPIPNEETEERVAYEQALGSLHALTMTLEGIEKPHTKGIVAGLPWFFQLWSRDEAVSLGALIKEGYYYETKEILYRHLRSIDLQGRMPARFPVGEKTADSTGWTFSRLYDLLETLQNERELERYFIFEDIELLYEKLEEVIVALLKNHTVQQLAVNGPGETWMDSVYGNDTRKGACIEIQALRLKMYRCMQLLSKKLGKRKEAQLYYDLEQAMHKKVKSLFWHDPVLADRVDETIDTTIRPNIFLAYSVYPELLSNEEWKRCLRITLEKLWLPWGGISTIAKDHLLFCSHSTGEDSKSYHRGDSWFWINNLAACCLHKVDRKEFRTYIENIKKASTEAMLYHGSIGNAPELSSASSLRAEGCWNQAWSNATYIELMHEIHTRKV
ncbi:hypothetical protein HYW21_04590 [Candidatus Woesearchaeota archaeon]|nr:hypothetical protein [Candidatus Woesearchaeota archaeon]